MFISKVLPQYQHFYYFNQVTDLYQLGVWPLS